MKWINLLQWVELLLYLLLIIGYKSTFAIMRCVSVDKELFANFPIIETFPTVLCFVLNAKKLQIRLNGYTLAHRQQNHCYQMDMNHSTICQEESRIRPFNPFYLFFVFVFSYRSVLSMEAKSASSLSSDDIFYDARLRSKELIIFSFCRRK